ncbi:ADP-glyceromanno-heptose 6-epimerase [Roseococcus sp. SYP-B2431]|uniref:ADP-glyceromanno-heptose 6-epimerase n=1 Tax=Roseococcus sp. SYP-B2431 TaxID=2496640 RepID=UPI00103C31AE|nr:ADP-glyceromanno-heptose 6-epimerase [Roseococcus sp. SYP-B2431]TCI00290.1 ADP-glyceromanno-heptose 6-epimerase [Roseococcus sp. SYP-B2431]
MILVTGGAGFIGSNLVAALTARGEEVVVLDELGNEEKWRNLSEAVLAGLLPPAAVDAALALRPAAVVHLGAVSATTVRDGDLVANTNFTLSLKLWDWCTAQGVPFLYASSAATYGSGDEGFEDEETPEGLARLRPLNLYGWSKHLFDRRVAQLIQLGRPRPPQWAGLKFFNVYGPREGHKGRMASVALHKFREIVSGQPARLFASDRDGIADGMQSRDFVSVGDCVRVMLWLLDNPRVSGLFNCGSGQARSFLDLTKAVYAALGLPERIEFMPMPDDLRGKYQYFTEAPMAKLRQAGYPYPPTPLEQGVADYVAWLGAQG